MFSSKSFLFSFAVSLGVLSAVACQTINQTAASFGQMSGNETLIKATHDLTPRQEHYLGRSILARILTEKQPVRSEELQNYVNQLGQYLAFHSSRTATFKGYRFIVIDDSAPTALSAPGGFVAVSSAMLRLSENEDELASVLAHEIAHVALRHAEQNIKNSNRMAFGQQIFSEVVQAVTASRRFLVFSEAISVGINSTFNKSQEFDADEGAVEILKRAGYSGRALYQVIERIPDSASFFGKHPRNKERMLKIQRLTQNESIAPQPLRTQRYLSFVKKNKI